MKKQGLSLDAVMALVIVLIVLLMGGYGLFVQRLPAEAVRFPLFVFGVVICAGIGEIIRSLRAEKRREEARPPVFHDRKNFLTVCGMILGYILLMYLVGFILSTILFAAAFGWRFRFRRLVPFGIAAAAVTVLLYFCFTKLMYIHLPQGLLLEQIL